MNKKIMVSVSPEETQALLLENHEVVEFMVQRTAFVNDQSCVGNIYKGKVKNVLPGMQAAFVDIGQTKNAFLYLGKKQAFTQGQEVIVQIAKESVGTKGPRATTELTLPGRYCVLMPLGKSLGISRRIESAEERDRLKKIAVKLKPDSMGLIVRTVAEGRSEAELEEDVAYLLRLWSVLTAKQKITKAPALLYRDVDLLIRLVRDYLSNDVEKFMLDESDAYQRVYDLVAQLAPQQLPTIELYQGSENMWQAFGLQQSLEQIGNRQVTLPSGGYLVIDRTEALTVVDVNTGRYVGTVSLAETVLKTNLEAAVEIARQLRLRDIGGIIIIDFIDMTDSCHQKQVLSCLNEQLKKDRTRTSVSGLTSLGLVEMTRKKSRQNVESTYYTECPCCHGRGRIKSPHTVVIRLLQALRKACQKGVKGNLSIAVHPTVAQVLKQEYGEKNLNRDFCRTIIIEDNPNFDPEGFSLLHHTD